MSRKEDVLFCKIALTNGLIDQKVATKALALCDQKEKESGRRPLIGAIFTKHNLMSNQEVQRIYTAVQKRLGTTVGPQLAPARGRGKGRRGKGGKGNGRESRFDRRSKPTRPIDPKTLWMGIGGIVVFLGIMVVLILLVLRPEAPPEGGVAGGNPDGVDINRAGPGPGTSPGTKTAGGGGATQPPAGGGMPDHVKMQVDDQVNDALSEKGTMAEAYVARLKDTKQKLAEKGYASYPPLERAIKELETIVANEAQEGPEPVEGAPEEPESTEPEEPVEEPAAEPPEEPAEEIDDLEKELEELEGL